MIGENDITQCIHMVSIHIPFHFMRLYQASRDIHLNQNISKVVVDSLKSGLYYGLPAAKRLPYRRIGMFKMCYSRYEEEAMRQNHQHFINFRSIRRRSGRQSLCRIKRSSPGPVFKRIIDAWGEEVGVDIIAQTKAFADEVGALLSGEV